MGATPSQPMPPSTITEPSTIERVPSAHPKVNERGKKRSSATSKEDADADVRKKRKLHGEPTSIAPNHKHSGKPQHLRGTAIRPNNDTGPKEKLRAVVTQDQAARLWDAQSSSDEAGEAENTSGQHVREDEADADNIAISANSKGSHKQQVRPTSSRRAGTVEKPRRERKHSKTASQKSAKKRQVKKSADYVFDSEDEGEAARNNEPGDFPVASIETSPNPPKRARADRSSSSAAAKQRGTVKGAWSNEEKVLADTIYRSCLSRFSLCEAEFRYTIMEWAAGGDFKVEINEAFPLRTISSIRKFCQRRYSHWDKGPWTAEQDTSLKEWHAKLPGQWAEIGGFVERSAQDCRDRWTNVLQYGDAMVKGPWSQGEEEDLELAVEQCMDLIKESGTDPSILGEARALERLIDWKVVSNSMGGARSAKRCLEKWRNLQHRRTIVQSKPAVSSEDMALKPSTTVHKTRNEIELGRIYQSFGWADICDAMHEICDATEETRDDTYEHESTFWSMVATNCPKSAFSSKQRRACYSGLNKHFETQLMLRDVDAFGARAYLLLQELLRLHERGEIKWERRSKVGSHENLLTEDIREHHRKREKILSEAIAEDEEMDTPMQLAAQAQARAWQDEQARNIKELARARAEIEVPVAQGRQVTPPVESPHNINPRLARNAFIARCQGGVKA